MATAAAAAFKALIQTATATASKALTQTATATASKAPAPAATAHKALEKMAFMALKQTASKAKKKDTNDNSYIDRLKTNIKILKRTDNTLIKEINKLKKLITILFK